MDTDQKKNEMESHLLGLFDELEKNKKELKISEEKIEKLKIEIQKTDQEGKDRLLETEKFYENGIEELRETIKGLNERINKISALSQYPPVFRACFLEMDGEMEISTDQGQTVVVKTAWVLAKGQKQTIGISPEVDEGQLKKGREVVAQKDSQSGEYTAIIKVLPFGPHGGEDICQIVRIEKTEDGDYAIIEAAGAMKHLVISEECRDLESGDKVLVSRAYDLVVCRAPALEDEIDRSKIDPVGYKDVGGLDEQIKQIKEVVELPFKEPERFKKMGVRAPRSILLKGQPGTGKTLLARAVANETDSVFFARSGAEFVSEGYRGTDIIKLQRLFEEAEKKRKKLGKKCAIIFIDEGDILLPIRDDLHKGQHEIEALVNAFLALMEGLKGRGEVVVITATNKPDKMDPAAKHRFDRQIDIPVPTDEGRLKILEIHTRNMPLVKDFDFEKVVEKTHGFVGRDIEHLCIEVALRADRRTRGTSEETSEELEVRQKDFSNVLEVMRPEGLGASVVTNTGVSFDDVAGLDSAKKELVTEIEALLSKNEFYTYIGLKPRKGILLVSLPGFGKTLLAKAVATECGMNFISIKGTDVHIMWYGMSARALVQPFRMGKIHAPCIIFLDELDTLVPWRGGRSGGPGADEKVVSAFNTEMDGVESMEGVIVIGATNRPDLVDPACLRRLCPGGKPIELGTLDDKAREKCFEIHTRNFSHTLAEDVDFKKLSKLTKERKVVISFRDRAFEQIVAFSGDEIRGLCEEAQRWAVRKFEKAGGGNHNKEEFKVFQKHFEKVIAEKFDEEKKKENGNGEEEKDSLSYEELDEIAADLDKKLDVSLDGGLDKNKEDEESDEKSK